MNPADYILPPDTVKARFPAELVGTPDYQTIVDACVERLELPQSGVIPASLVRRGVAIQITNAEGDDFRDEYVTLTVSCRVSPTRIESAMRMADSGVMAADELRRAMRFA